MEHSIIKDGLSYTLTDIEKDCWQRLLNGSLRSKDPLHNPVVANINDGLPVLRTVVLRKVIIAERKLFFHTDIRSVKWKALELNENISWLFYDSTARFQIRAAGKTALHHNDVIADTAWQNTAAASRKNYMGDEGPSQKSEAPTSGLPEVFLERDPTLIESEQGRKNFGVVSSQITWLEWLWLNSKGHKKAVFNYNPNGFDANWIIP